MIINFLVVVDIILAILIIASMFFHGGNDGFMGEATQTIATDIKFETYDKIIAGLVLTFFIVNLMINYLDIYHAKGTADIDEINRKAKLEKNIKELDVKKSEMKTEAPLAQE